MFNLEVSLIQDFKGATIVEVIVKGHNKVGVNDGSDESRVFSRG